MPPRTRRRFKPPDAPDFFRVYYSRAELTKTIEEADRGEPTPPENPVLGAVLEIPGIVAAQVNPYSITVVKAPPFEWSEIEPHVQRLLDALNLGEGKLNIEPQSEKESKTMKMDDISSADLGNGFKLMFQEARNGTVVRAIVKDATGKIVVTGPQVPRAQAWNSRMAVLTSPESRLWAGMPLTPNAPPDESEFEDEEEEDEDEDEEDEEEEEEDED